jgi:hypothetical protein
LNRFGGDDRGRRQRKQPESGQAFVGAKPQHHVADRGIGDRAQILIRRGEQARRAQCLVALVDADQKFRRSDPGLDGAELGALDLPGNGAELAGRKDFALDEAAGVLLHRRGETLHPFMLGVVECGGAQFHRIGRRVLGAGGRRGNERRNQGGGKGPGDGADLFVSFVVHVFLLCGYARTPSLLRRANGSGPKWPVR